MAPLLALALTALTAGVVAPPADSIHRGDTGDVGVVPPRLEQPAIAIDGRLDEAAWAQAAVLGGFTQYEPVEGIPAREPTEVLVFYTAEAIYFGVRALDRSPQLIQASLSERDRSIFSDDWVRLMLDTYGDGRQAYVFYVNPYGIQTDGLWLEGLSRGKGESPVPIDFNPDFLWDSYGAITADGWVAEIRVPFVSLRFRDAEVQDWGFNVAREVRRSGFKDAWAPLTQEASSTLAQSGRLEGLRGLRPGRLLEANPVATGKRAGGLDEEGAYVRDGFRPEVGLNARLGLTRDLVLDGTINPDFSQIEADADQLTVNERFAVFFPEKRPFFLGGTEVFNTPQRLVHTRQIVDPVGGAKLTGRVGAFSLGYLGAIDEGSASADETPGRSAVNLLRVRRDVGSGSTVGLLYTDRSRFDGAAHNRVLAGDARLLFGGRYAFTAQLARSWTEDPLDPGADAAPLMAATLSRAGRGFGFDLRYSDSAPGFRTRAGFLQRIGEANLSGTVRATHFGAPGALVERYGVDVQLEGFYDHDDFWDGRGASEAELEVRPSVSLRGDHGFNFILRDGYYRFLPDAYAGYEVSTGAGGRTAFVAPDPLRHMLALAVVPRFRLSGEARLDGRAYFREVPIYAEASRGFEVLLGPKLQLRPAPAVLAEASHTISRIWRRDAGGLFSSADITRLKAQYQFTRALFARAIAQYKLEERDALRDPRSGALLFVSGEPAVAAQTSDFQGQLLLSYEPSPGTIVYFGWSRQLADDQAYTWDVRSMDRTADGVFLKLSWLFRG